MDLTMQVTNPVIVVDILMAKFRTMDPAEFQKAVADAVTRGEQFAKSDDTVFSSSLDEAEATMYACYVRQFLEALKELKEPEKFQSIQGPRLAKTIAYWQVVTTFKTLHKEGRITA
jgi:hypothetical protein